MTRDESFIHVKKNLHAYTLATVSQAELAALHRLCFYEFHRKFRTLLLNTKNSEWHLSRRTLQQHTQRWLSGRLCWRRLCDQIRTRSTLPKNLGSMRKFRARIRTYNISYRTRGRADEAERKLVEVTAHLKTVNEARLIAM